MIVLNVAVRSTGSSLCDWALPRHPISPSVTRRAKRRGAECVITSNLLLRRTCNLSRGCAASCLPNAREGRPILACLGERRCHFFVKKTREINLFPDVWNLVFSQGRDLPSASLTNQCEESACEQALGSPRS